MAKVRHIESILRFITADIEPRKGGLWLFLARMLRHIPETIWAWCEDYLLSRALAKRLQLIRSIGGLHFAPVDLASVAAIHQFRQHSATRFIILPEPDVNAPLVAAIINNLFEPCLFLESQELRIMKWRAVRECDRLLGIRRCELGEGVDVGTQIIQTIANGQSVIASVANLRPEEISRWSELKHVKFLQLSWSRSNGDCYFVRFESIADARGV